MNHVLKNDYLVLPYPRMFPFLSFSCFSFLFNMLICFPFVTVVGVPVQYTNITSTKGTVRGMYND